MRIPKKGGYIIFTLKTTIRVDSISIEILNRLNEKGKLLVFKQKTSFESNAIINKFLTKDKSNDLISIITFF